ncbi:MAG: hypothetical protein EOM85_04525 [Candidatus Moranbacteria bacterium]|nr:hypothetical protein [Candidatus Moranbacteria bacterium]
MAALISLEYQKMLERIKEKSKQNNKERITQKIPEDGIYCDKCNNDSGEKEDETLESDDIATKTDTDQDVANTAEENIEDDNKC